jgi:hypothetical protein
MDGEGGKRIVRNLRWWKEDSDVERFGHDWAFVY